MKFKIILITIISLIMVQMICKAHNNPIAYTAQSMLFDAGLGAKPRAMLPVQSVASNKTAIVPAKKELVITNYEDLLHSDNIVEIYPIPTQDEITINYNFKEDNSNASLDIYDMIGRKVISSNLMGKTNQIKISMSQLANGEYMAVIKNNNLVINTQRLAVQK